MLGLKILAAVIICLFVVVPITVAIVGIIAGALKRKHEQNEQR